MLTDFRPGDRVVAVAPKVEKSKAVTTRGPSALRKLVGVVVLASLGYILFQRLHISTSGTQPGSLLHISSPQVIFDEEIAVDAGGWQSRSFTLSSTQAIQVVAEGKTHTDNGFSLYVMAPSELQNFRQETAFRHIPDFEGLKVRSLSRTATLPAGTWVVVVANTENYLNTMAVKLRVVGDP
jgi:hypothetical protein